jgi:hypothetical protein
MTIQPPHSAILFLATFFCTTMLWAQTPQGQAPNLQRGLQNYQEVILGKKKLEQLSSQEKQEVLLVYRRMKAKSEDGKSSECRDARSRAESSASELADRSHKLRSCAEAQDYSDDCSSEFRRVKNAQSDYEDAVSSFQNECR